jgi:hypothetical protein
VSPVSRGRRKKSKPGRTRQRPLDAFGEALRDFKVFGAVFDPLLAEVAASESLDQLPAERLIDYAGGKPNPAALALLRALQAVGLSEEQRVAARSAADRLADRGVSEPTWAGMLEQVVVGDCWEFADVYGDLGFVVVVFERAGVRHALVATADFNDSSNRAVDVADDPDGVLAGFRARASECGPFRLRQVSAERARRFMEDCLAAPGIEGRAVVMARTRLMPEPEPAVAPREYTDAERDEMVSEFLAEADGLEGGETVRVCVRLIVDYGCDRDAGRPLRIGPGKVSAFLEQVSAGVDAGVLAEVLPAWIRWTAAKAELPAVAVEHMLEELEGVADPEFPLESYLDGLAPGASQREIDETLERRRFAMPSYSTEILGEYFDYLDPSDRDDRRTLLIGEYPEYQEALEDPSFDGTIDGVNPRLFIALREILINQLWDDTPPEAWQAAKRLLEAGHGRQAILSEMGCVLAPHIEAALAGRRFDEKAYRNELRNL